MSQSLPMKPGTGYPADSQTDLLRKLVWNTWFLGEGSTYVAANPSDWAGTPPTTIREAIDRLAANNPGS